MIDYGVPQEQIDRLAPVLEKLRAELAAAMTAMMPDAAMAVDLDLSEQKEDDE